MTYLHIIEHNFCLHACLPSCLTVSLPPGFPCECLSVFPPVHLTACNLYAILTVYLPFVYIPVHCLSVYLSSCGTDSCLSVCLSVICVCLPHTTLCLSAYLSATLLHVARSASLFVCPLSHLPGCQFILSKAFQQTY
jgi:hypothetical protein